MKHSRFTEEQIIGVRREQKAGGEDDGRLPPPRGQRGDLLQVEGQAAEGAGGGFLRFHNAGSKSL